MAKFTINKDTDHERSVDAVRFVQSGGYFRFLDRDEDDVLAIREKDVFTVEREPS
jgi:hypothetical protein